MFQLNKNNTPVYQKYFNANEQFTKEEIKYLKKINPDLNNLFKVSSTNINYINKDTHLKTENNKDSSKILISKKRFFSLILEELKKSFEKNKDKIMSKIISLLINETISISKIIQENEILTDFFHKIKKDRNSYFNDTKKIIDTNKKLKIKNDLNSKSEQHFERIITNGNNIFKNSNKKINLEKNSSFSEIDNKKDINKSIEPENGIININMKKDIINKNNNFVYCSLKKLKINKKNENNRTNEFSNLNNKTSLSKKKRSFIDIDNNSNKSFSIVKTKYKITNYIIKKQLKFNKFNPKKLKKEKKPSKNTFSKKKKQDPNPKIISIIEFVNSNNGIFDNIETENFDIFELEKKVGRSNVLPLIGYYVFNHLGFHDILNYNKFENWCKKIDEGYLLTNSYHNSLHAADITQTCLNYLKLGKIDEICNFSKNSKCSLFLSCMCHDYKHPGVNNNFLKETKNLIALTYNDTSILENMHISETFKLINSNDTYNIFDKIDINTYKQFRKEMISCVLSTDMAFHNDYVNFAKEKIEDTKNGGENKNKPSDYQNYLNLLIHSADISNPTKPFEIYFKWAKLVVNEFYDQGDKEKKLGLNCSCDRNKVTIYQSQLGFINYIELPFFSLFEQLFPKLKFYSEQLSKNKNILISMEEEEKKKKEEK